MFNDGKATGVRKGLTITLTLVLLLLVLPPVGQAETQQEGLANAWRLPFVRLGHTAILDTPHDRIIVFGGWNGQQFFNDVWALDLTTGAEAWTKLNPAGAWPGARGQHTAIYDEWNDRMIVYGGHGLHYDYDDVWALDLHTVGSESWTQLQPTGETIGARRYHTAIYDRTGQRVIVFGGSRGGNLLNDTWALNVDTPGAESWAPLAVTGSVPAARVQHTAIYDSADELMIVFGGGAAGGLRNDTWALDLTTLHWAQLAPGGTPPPARRGHTSVYNSGQNIMMVFTGLGGTGFLNDLWKLDLTPGARQWVQLSATGGPPAPRAWHTATYQLMNSSIFVLGGRGMDSLAGETQWLLNIGGMNWSALTPTLPDWWTWGAGARSMQTGEMPEVTLEIEDAPAGTRAHLLLGHEMWFVVKLKTTNAAYATDVDVTLDVVDPKFDVTQVGTRHKDADDVTNWTTPGYLGGGRYRILDVDLTKEGSDAKFQTQVVFKATPKAETTGTSVTAIAAGTSWTAALESTATARIHRDPPAWIVTNRTQLFEQYGHDNVRSLLDAIYEVAESRSAVVFYLDRDVPDLATWDNTAVSYASETAANGVAHQVAEWLVTRIVSFDPYPTFAYPTYLAIVGDDNIIPRYRKADYNLSVSEGDAPNCWGMEPVCDALVSHNYFFTENPYGDLEYGTVHQDWDEGGLEAAVGRIVGGSALDMHSLLDNAAAGPLPQEDRAIIASGDGDVSDCFDWWLPGADNDPQNVLKIFMGYSVNESLIDSAPSKAQILAEMQAGFSVAALAHHGEVTAWSTPDDGDHLWSYEVPDYDPQDLMPENLPFFYFDACRVGLTYGSGWDDPEEEDGPQAYDDSLIYGLIHQGISGAVASGGLMYLMPGNNSWAAGETLSNNFWARAKAYPDRSNPLGWALKTAKAGFAIADDYDKKTVQTFTYFGLPWMRLTGYATRAAGTATTAGPQIDATSPLWSVPALKEAEAPAAPTAAYVVNATVDASTYAISTTVEGFDLIAVQGLSQRTADGQVVLPEATLELILPLSATVTNLVFTPTQDLVLPGLDIPTAQVGAGLPDAPEGGYVSTPDGLYPATASFESSVLDGYQLVRVHVVPVTYDATQDQATLHRTVDVSIEYDTPKTIALTYFEPDKLQYVPGETIGTLAQLANAGDAPETVTATLVLQDTQGQIVGFKASGPFAVPAGGTYDLAVDWTGPLDGDNYLARLLVWQAGQVLTGAGAWLQVTAGEVSDVTAPKELAPGEEGIFSVTFDNLSAAKSVAAAGLAIYDQDDSLVAFLPSQSALVDGGGSATLTFFWAPDVPGEYTASFMLQAGGQEYGPLLANVSVQQHHIYLPVVLRAAGD